MKFRIFNRDIEIDKRSYYVNNFKNEKVLIGFGFNLKTLTIKDIKLIVMGTLMPYKILNKWFLAKKI